MTEELRRVETPLGPIEYYLTVKPVKNINLRIRSDGAAAVSVPRQVSRTAADSFVRDHADWVLAHQSRRAAAPPPLAAPDKRAALPVLTAALERMYPLVAPLGVK